MESADTFSHQALAANQLYAQSFDKGHLQAPPLRKAAILTCMDARLLPARFLGLEEGDAHVIRNAGGRVSDDVIRSLVISSHLLGTSEYLIVHHTDCGLMRPSDEDIVRRVGEAGVDAATIQFLTYRDLDQSVRDDIEQLAASPMLPAGIPITGLVYDVFSGSLRAVHEDITRGT